MDTQQPSKIKFDLSFIDEAKKYIEIYKKSGRRPSVEGFANRIGTDKDSVIAWADKRKKDEQGNVTTELARPTFHQVIQEIIQLETAPEEKDKLNPQQEMFCQLYARSREYFGNGVAAYAAAYGIDPDNKSAYDNARRSASLLLTNIDVRKRCSELLRAITDEEVDEELIYIIRQNDELPSKIAAIREWNKVKQRITEKVDLTSKGKQITGQIVGFNYLPPAKNDGTDNTNDQANA